MWYTGASTHKDKKHIGRGVLTHMLSVIKRRMFVYQTLS